jgi:uncharacterized cupin superfamily protein
MLTRRAKNFSCDDRLMDRPNVFQAQFEYDDSDPAGFRCGEAKIAQPGGDAVNVGQAAGGNDNNVRLFEVPPNMHLVPYHYEYEEEWLLVLEGQVLLRTPEGEETLASGALVCFPTGPAGAHQVSGTGQATARLMMWSSASEPAVAVYPDSDKIGVWTGDDHDSFMLRRTDGSVDYWDGEG